MPLSGVGFTPERAAEFPLVPVAALEQLLDPAYMRHGCIVMERDVAVERAPDFGGVYSSVSNGRGPLAWNHHWVVVPLHDSAGRLDGMMWVDDPKDRLLPSDEALQALRVFANQAMGAIESARRLEQPRAPRRARPAHRAAQPPRLRAGDRRATSTSSAPTATCRCSSSTSTTSSASTTRSATTPATTCCGASPRCCARRPARPTCPRGSGGEEFALVLPGAGEARALARGRAHLRLLVRARVRRLRRARVGVGRRGRAAGPRRATPAELHARRQPRALRRQAARARPLRRPPRADAGDARRAARRRGRRRREQLAAAMLLAETLDLRDVATARHSETVGRYAEQIARELGFAARAIERVRAAGILHDIGKLGIADAILHKPGTLDDARVGSRSSATPSSARGSSSTPTCATSRAWVLHHHERVDGTGYPQRAGRRRDPARGAHPRRRGRLRGDDLRPPVPRARCRSRPRARSCAAARAPVRRRGRRRHRARARPLAGRLRRDARGARSPARQQAAWLGPSPPRTARRARLNVVTTAARTAGRPASPA